jgi:anti-sigma B factor antagonist
MHACQVASAQLAVEDGVARVRIRGELDISTQAILADSLDEACSRGVPVHLDLSEVTFMAASALAMIVTAHRCLTGLGCHLEIVRSSDVVKNLLQLTDMAWLENEQPTETLGEW